MIKPAIYWMDKPRWRVDQCKIRYLDLIRVHKLNHVWSGYIQESAATILRPPSCTLAVNRAIVAY